MFNPLVLPVPTLKDNYVWTMINREDNTAIIVDPGIAAPVADFLQSLRLQLKAILITHHHWDHTNGIAELVNPGLPVYGAAAESIPHKTIELNEKEEVKIAGFPSFHVLAIPGHTLGHIAYYAPGILFCGDTLFAAGCGRLFEGTAAQLFSSLQKMAGLPDETAVYCAHEYTLNNLRFAAVVEPDNQEIKERLKYVSELREKGLVTLPSNLRDEKATNPFLRCHLPEVKAQVERNAQQKFDEVVEVFAALRQWKDRF